MHVEHYVEYFHPGFVVSEKSSTQLSQRSTALALEKMPRGAFGFCLYDVEVRSGTLEDGSRIYDRKTANKSGIHYPGGRSYTVEEVRALPGDYDVLISNMEINRYKRVVETRSGNFQPLADNDVIL